MELLFESLRLGIAPALVVAIYLTINKIIDNKKEAQQTKLSNNVVQSFNKLNTFLDYITKDIIEKENEKRTIAIKNAFFRMENELLKYANHTIINNNININKKNIIDNLHHLINTEYYNLYNILMLHSSTKVNLLEFIKVEWKEELFNDVFNIIFNEEFTKEQKIYTIQNKLNIRISDYSINVINKNAEYDH